MASLHTPAEDTASFTLSRQDLAAFEFLNLQEDLKDWFARVKDEPLPADQDLYAICRDGTFLCELINHMFPGCLKRYHKRGAPPAKQLENIDLFIRVCTKMGMARDTLFDPLDLNNRQNMMRVLVALETMAKHVQKNGYPVIWKEKQKRNFSMQQLKRAEEEYQPSKFVAQKQAKKKASASIAPSPAVAAVAAAQLSAQQQEIEAPQAYTPAPAVSQQAVLQSENVSQKQLHEEEDTSFDYSTLDSIALTSTTKLHLAVEEHLQPLVDHFLTTPSGKLDAKAGDCDGNTPLHIAAIVANVAAARSLLASDAKVNVNAINQRGDTPLHLAVAQGDEEMIALLIAHGADVNAKNAEGQTPLHVAALSGNGVAALLNAGAVLTAYNRDGNTPLHLAAWRGHEDVVERMLQAAPERLKEVLAAGNADGNTALHFASLRGRVGIVDKLLAAGAPVDAQNRDGSTPLQLATEADERDVVEAIVMRGHANLQLSRTNGWTPLYTAAYNGNRDMVDFLCSRGANPNEQNGEGWAPLHAAASQGHYKVVKAMIQKWNAKVNIQTKEGTTPLFFAAHTGRPKITELLLKEAHADPNLGAAGGWLPLHGAIYNDYDAVVVLLLDAGAQLDSGVDEIKGYAPIHIAIASEQANVPVVKSLIARGCDINKQTNNGATALHLAVFWGNKHVVKILVDAGARLDLRNNKKRRPLELAAHYGHEEIAQYLARKMNVQVPKMNTKAERKIASMAVAALPPKPDEEQ